MLRPAALLIAALLLVGCMPVEPTVTPVPEPSVTPIFASDEDALAAATEAYAKYLEVSDAVRSENGRAPERISEFVTTDRLEDELESFSDFAKDGRSTVGLIAFDSVKLQRYFVEPPGVATVVMYLCLDASAIKFVDQNGNDVTTAEKPDRQLFEVTMVSGPTKASNLVLSGSELWSNDSNC